MAQYNITVGWDAASGSEHYRWKLENGTEIVGTPPSNPDDPPRFLDPEEAFVGSLSSCHLLSFLAAAAKAGFHVSRYEDHAVGILDKNEQGRIAVTRVLLQPTVTFGTDRKPTVDELKQLHEKANRDCFIANSVKTQIVVEPRVP
ncbi:MAG: OsmC family protein [Pseudomonadota bacterium]